MRKCPECKSRNVRKSRQRVKGGVLLKMFSPWLRCQNCNAKFRAVDWSSVSWWAIAVGLTMGFAGFLAESSNFSGGAQSAPSGEEDSHGYAVASSEQEIAAAAQQGDAEACYKLALNRLAHNQGTGSREALKSALELLKTAAEGQHAQAQASLGSFYEEGKGVIQDFSEAAQWYRKAAEQGSPEAMHRLGLLHQSGKGVPRDAFEAYVWLNLASARGNELAESSRDLVRSLLPQDKINSAQIRSRDLDRKIPRLKASSETKALLMPTGI